MLASTYVLKFCNLKTNWGMFSDVYRCQTRDSMNLIIKLLERTTKKRHSKLPQCIWKCIENDHDDESYILDY
jgi:hypothetical protein